MLVQLAAAVSAFDAALGELNVRNQVTTFTASDFGRTLASNGDGSDHGWGAHHFVVGGAVKGRDIYGQFPVVAIGTNDDAGQGRFIPTTSVDQYAASFARWMGLSDAQLADVLPNLQYFAPPRCRYLFDVAADLGAPVAPWSHAATVLGRPALAQ